MQNYEGYNICVDIDETILYSEYDEESNEYRLVNYNKKLITKLNNLYEKGYKIIIFTGRHWNHFEITIQQLKICGIKYNTLMMGKPVVDFFIDDKAIKPEDFIKLEIGGKRNAK